MFLLKQNPQNSNSLFAVKIHTYQVILAISLQTSGFKSSNPTGTTLIFLRSDRLSFENLVGYDSCGMNANLGL